VNTIAFDGRALASPAGGVRRYVTELFGALAVAHPEVRWVGIGAPADRCPPGVVAAPASRSLPTNLGWMATGLPAATRRLRPALLHAPAYAAPLAPGCPVVVTLHDVSYARHPEWYPGQLDPLRRWFYRRSATSAARILTDSTFSRDEIVAAYGIDAARIAVVPLAAGSAFVPPAAGAARTPTVLHVGDLHPRRNLSMLLDVVIALRTSHPALSTLVLRLIGADRGIASALVAQAASAGHADALQIDGQIPESALVEAYQTAAVLAYPSQYEGFGLPLLEAMACGTPVVASRAASMPEVVGDAGILVSATDRQEWFTHLRRVCTEVSVARAMADAGYTRAATFTWARTADLTFAAYRSL
jgi:glycosyltransferase involved in cell wall biosynthesis